MSFIKISKHIRVAGREIMMEQSLKRNQKKLLEILVPINVTHHAHTTINKQ
jgi:hypothetical protein